MPRALPRLAGGLVVAALVLTASPTGASPTYAAPTNAAEPARAAQVPSGDGGPNRYSSEPPPRLLGQTASAPATVAEKPRTKGVVVGQVVGPGGRPVMGALVSAVRSTDLGSGSGEQPVVTRTGRDGRFRLAQPREDYLVRVCSEAVTDGARTRTCDPEASKRFTPTYLGPDGTLDSWMRHTRLFSPQRPRRTLGRVTVQPSAVVTGTYRDGAGRTVYLTRTDGSTAATTQADRTGRYRFEVAPGPYRVEADHDEGLRTPFTVPGFRSKRFVARVGRTHREDVRTRHAGIIRGQVTAGGSPRVGEFLAVLDQDGRFAAGVTTNELGRYVVSSLRPGTYTVATGYSSSTLVPAGRTVTATLQGVAVADLALEAGRSVTFTVTDSVVPGSSGQYDAELRTPDGRVAKSSTGAVGGPGSAGLTFTGMPPGFYRLLVRRHPTAPGQSDLPWTDTVVDLSSASSQRYDLLLSQPAVTLTGALPVGAQLRLTPLPADGWLQPAFLEGSQTTALASTWTVGESGGRYAVHGLVPGSYSATVTASPTSQGNVATTRSTVIVDGAAPVIDFTAPAGGTVTARLRYARSDRPVIAPFAVVANDTGDQAWPFPSVSAPGAFGRPVKVQRLHAGSGQVRLLDPAALEAEHPETAIAGFLAGAARSEPGTAYWFSAGARPWTVTAGGRDRAGVLELRLHGVGR